MVRHNLLFSSAEILKMKQTALTLERWQANPNPKPDIVFGWNGNSIPWIETFDLLFVGDLEQWQGEYSLTKIVLQYARHDKNRAIQIVQNALGSQTPARLEIDQHCRGTLGNCPKHYCQLCDVSGLFISY